MDIKKLFSGVAVIIDDKINKRDSGDKIIIIRDKLKKYNIPILEYEDIPENSEIKNLNNISFVLLDWELFERPEPGLPLDEAPFINNNIKFLRQISKTNFLPIFIFSNIAPDSIIRILSDKGIYKEKINNYIFVKRKDELFSSNNSFLFFSIIKKWLKETPSIYALKEWEQSQKKAMRDLFWSFYEVNHNWPSVLQDTFTKDGSDVNYELGNFIFKNIMARTEPIIFDKEILKLEDSKISKGDIRKILEAERFIQKDSLPDIPFTGDLFEYEVDINGGKEKRYYLNIRPECDIAIRKNGTSNPELYCLKGGKIVNEELINSDNKEHKTKKIEFINGSFIEKSNKIFLPFIVRGKIIEFSLNDIIIKKWNSLKTSRKGRLLPPYITRVQQQYSFYLQRQGLPAIPGKAIE